MNLDEAIDEAWQAGCAAWPTVRLARADFAAWAIAQTVDQEALATRGADLYLVAACVGENTDAFVAFEKEFLAPLTGRVGRITLSADQADELRQQLRCTLLLPPQPKIGLFRGQGPLGAWVRVCAVRAALALVAARDARPETDTLVLDQLMSPHTDQEVAAIKSQYRDAFQGALEECFAKLPPRSKTLLRMHFLDGMSIDAMGLVFRVHRATVARWLVGIRHEVLEEICRKISFELRTSSSEFTQLVHLVRSEVQLSIRRILGEQDRK